MEVFDKVASDYDIWYESKMGGFVDQVETELAFKLFKPQKGMKILDVGCGTGNFSLKLAEMGCEVVGIDISEKMLAHANKKKREGLDLKFYLMDIYDLNFSDQEFDGVFSMAAFEFISEIERAYKEMYRVLKKNGKLLIGTINKESKWGALYSSPQVAETTIYKYASFKSLNDLKSLNASEIIGSGECLFIPPDTREDKISLSLEKQLSNSERGGFICVQWKKGHSSHVEKILPC